MGCGCEQRRARLNRLRPGLGDAVAELAEPVKAMIERALSWLGVRRG